jgi:hypothetical protein
MTGFLDVLKPHEHYEELPVFDAKSFDPETYLIIPEGVGGLPKLQELLVGYKELARLQPPKWQANNGQDLEVRAFELLSQDCPRLCVWRGGDYEVEGLDYSLQLAHAAEWVNYTFGGKRINPVLVGVPLKGLVEAYKKGKIRIGAAGSSVGAISITPYRGHLDINKTFKCQIFRAPSHLTPNEQSSWISTFKRDTSQKSGITDIEYLSFLVSRRLAIG